MSEDKTKHNSPCQGQGHSKHLCILTSNYFHVQNPDEYRAMVKDARFKCEFCGRTARSESHLWYPSGL